LSLVNTRDGKHKIYDLPSFYDGNNIWREVQIMEISTVQFCPALLGPYTFLSTLFSNTLSLCLSLSARDQVLHPYKATDNVIVLYIFVFVFFRQQIEGESY